MMNSWVLIFLIVIVDHVHSEEAGDNKDIVKDKKDNSCCDVSRRLTTWQGSWEMFPTVGTWSIQTKLPMTTDVEEEIDLGRQERGKYKVKKKFKKILLPLLLAYKLKFFTLIPVLIGGLVLLTGATGLAGFFFALFAATMGGQHLNNTDYHDIEARKKKDKYLLTLILGGLIVKAIVFPIALKVMAVMTSLAVLLSLMSLIISSIVGYIKVALRHQPRPFKVIHLTDHVWSKDEGIDWDNPYYEHEPYYDHDHYFDSREKY
ncbi:unnamed protein product [Brassicogethes aeneus]|uniref:Uncharacterized protein n=1 Tax=Brassicogethes aeneus TaxID=1431903 RepID=A0A9P0FJ61_BRAAE|nr:unnamed protein product [Brassicogethes aeneus]